mgnify:CR=1 FL=1
MCLLVPRYVSPNTIRAQEKKQQALEAQERMLKSHEKKERALNRPEIRDELQEIFQNPAADLDSDDDAADSKEEAQSDNDSVDSDDDN